MYPNIDSKFLYCDYNLEKPTLTTSISFAKYYDIAVKKGLETNIDYHWYGVDFNKIKKPFSPIKVLKYLKGFEDKKELHDLTDDDWTKQTYLMTYAVNQAGMF